MGVRSRMPECPKSKNLNFENFPWEDAPGNLLQEKGGRGGVRNSNPFSHNLCPTQTFHLVALQVALAVSKRDYQACTAWKGCASTKKE